ncbi:hypothetical protein I350_07457 [Cryptococcus amylolentus CBS 6273]|uniref:Uncharacterized protein n=1 Tax=Cryptococcus amylolentus CBS 6273 TaxID=1296118 RepID=A0A1E3JEP1_9TREE|nr:hypothetical protein I350_07457 [Cryptococcus amylolentus CBS 6273]
MHAPLNGRENRKHLGISINDATVVGPATNPPIAIATASHADSARCKGKAPAVPPSSQTSVVNVYPSDIGHPANVGLGGPLQLVPFDLTICHRYPNSFTINPYSDVYRPLMGSFWTKRYPKIPNECEFQINHIVPYLREFYVYPKAVAYPTTWSSNVNFHETLFYLPSEEGFVNLPPVRSIRDHDTELKVRSLTCAPELVADQLLCTASDAFIPECIPALGKAWRHKARCRFETGYHIGDLAEGTYQKEPAGGRELDDDDDPQKVLYALIKDSWLPWPEARNVDLQEKINLHLKGLQFANMEAITQTIYYSELVFTLSKCRSAIALANGDYTLLKGVTLGEGGDGRILVEADPALVAKLRYHRYHCLSAEQFGALAAEDTLFGIQWKVPNSLIANYKDRSLNQEAKKRLDATIYLNLALATHHPTVPGPHISNHSLTNVIDADASAKVAYQCDDVSKKMKARRPSRQTSTDSAVSDTHDQDVSKIQKRAHISGLTEHMPYTPESMVTTSPPTPSLLIPSPSSFLTISSRFETELPVSVEEWCLSVKQEACTNRTFIDSAIPPNPLSFTTAGQVLPLEHWTHGDYIDCFSRYGLTFVLATPMEVDVLLARTVRFGWAGALGRR